MAPRRNTSLLEKCFFTERFTKQYLEQLARCGVRLGVQHTMLLCLGMRCCFPSSAQKDPWLLGNDPSDADYSSIGNWRVKTGHWRVSCAQPRRTEELQVIRHLDNGVQQFVCQLPGERPPHTQSLWVSADGYFYALYITPADVSHKTFKTPTMVLKAAA